MKKSPITPDIFDPVSDWQVSVRKLPHWAQAGTLTFITFRTCDSIPKLVLEDWYDKRQTWLKQHAILVDSEDWREKLMQLAKPAQEEFRKQFTSRWEEHLDACHGECVLRQSDLASIVADSLQHFSGQHYILTDFVVMPNHVHLIAAFSNDREMTRQCKSWKQFTATQINRKLGRKGNFWQKDSFDHLIRSEEQYFACKRYIANNPIRAKLKLGEFVHFSDTNQ